MAAKVPISINSLFLTAYITMFGVEVTIFTVIYSFIVSKRAYFKAISHDMKIQKIPSTYLHTEMRFAIEYMNKLKKLNIFVICLAVISLILYGWSLFDISEIKDSLDLSCSQIILGWTSIVYIVATLTLLGIYIAKYFKEVKF